MRILVIGQAGTYPSRGYSGIMHGSHVRPLALARAMAANGHRVSMLDQAGEGPTVPVAMDHLIREGFISSYDAVVVVGISGLWRVRNNARVLAEIMRHPRTALVVDTIYFGEDSPESTAWLRVVAASSSIVAAEYKRRRHGSESLYVPWCCPDDIPAQPNPWPDDRPRALFVGVVHERYIPVLNTVAERLVGIADLWLAGIFRTEETSAGLTSDQRRRLLHPAVHLATDIFKPTDLGEGPVAFEDGGRMMQHATVGLNLVPSATRDTMGTSCKIYDYAAAGLRVVTEPSPASDGDVVALRAGTVVPWNDPDSMAEATRALLAQQHDRASLRAHALTRFSWKHSAAMLTAALGA